MLTLKQWTLPLLTLLVLNNCGGGSSTDTTTQLPTTQTTTEDEFSRSDYKGLTFYYKNLPTSAYSLTPLSDEKFNTLSEQKKLQVAHKLFSTLFFGYPLNTLKEKLASEHFLSDVQEALTKDNTDKAWLEEHLLDENTFKQYSSWYEPQAITILTRFYAMKHLDKYFFHNWIAYILTQTIMFSPAYELDSSHSPNIGNVYNRLVTMLNVESGMRYITYVHMMSEDNWRRFRSPEDNGREMLEIYLYDTNDSHVPLAGKALKNWKLNTDYDTLEVSLNENREPISLFGTTIYNGDDFYRELVKSDAFTQGVTQRLVAFFFPELGSTAQEKIVSTIVESHPETWQDILSEIIFSEAYLLSNHRTQSAEETFYSLAKRISYQHDQRTFGNFKNRLEEMHQATMKYKLGKLERVPQDTLSFAYYHKYIRETILLRHSSSDDYSSWRAVGWQDIFVDESQFDANPSDDVETLYAFVNYLFQTIVSRDATPEEQRLFREHMIYEKDGKQLFRYDFNIFVSYDDPEKELYEQSRRRQNITQIVLDYLSRLEATYRQEEVTL